MVGPIGKRFMLSKRRWNTKITGTSMFSSPDAVFSDLERSLESFVTTYGRGRTSQVEKEFWVATDLFNSAASTVNAGVFMVKNTESGRRRIQAILDTFPHLKGYGTPEQLGIQSVVFAKDSTQRMGLAKGEKLACHLMDPKTAVLPQRSFNSLHRSASIVHDEAIWCPGDFIAHFAGASDKDETIPKFIECLSGSGFSGHENCAPAGAKAICRKLGPAFGNFSETFTQCTQ